MQSFTLLLSLLASTLRAEVPAHVQSEYGQLVTSSTLSWSRAGAGMSPPLGAVDSGTGEGFMCRNGLYFHRLKMFLV